MAVIYPRSREAAYLARYFKKHPDPSTEDTGPLLSTLYQRVGLSDVATGTDMASASTGDENNQEVDATSLKWEAERVSEPVTEAGQSWKEMNQDE